MVRHVNENAAAQDAACGNSKRLQTYIELVVVGGRVLWIRGKGKVDGRQLKVQLRGAFLRTRAHAVTDNARQARGGRDRDEKIIPRAAPECARSERSVAWQVGRHPQGPRVREGKS